MSEFSYKSKIEGKESTLADIIRGENENTFGYKQKNGFITVTKDVPIKQAMDEIGQGAMAITARFQLFICDNCGFVHFLVPPKTLDKVRKSKKFTKDH